MKTYLAARYARKAELLVYAKELEEMGHEVTSTWINQHNEVDDLALYTDEQNASFAYQDLQDIDRADYLISFTDSGGLTGRGGRHIELGYALGRKNKAVILIGPQENIFHYLISVRFDNWTDFKSWLEEELNVI